MAIMVDVPSFIKLSLCSNLLNNQPVTRRRGEDMIITQASSVAGNFFKKRVNDAVKKKAIPVPWKNWSQKSFVTSFHSDSRTLSNFCK